MRDLPDLGELLALRQALGIVHHIPGRIRLRLGSAISEWAAGEGFDGDQALGWLQSIPSVLGIRLNPAAASLIIEYDSIRLDPDWWETLVLGDDTEALALVLGLLAGD